MSDASASAAADKLIAWLPYDGEDRTERFMQLYWLTEDQFKGNLQNETPGTEAPRLVVGQHLFTRDGRKFGNAIVCEVDEGGRVRVETDFGNGGSWLSVREVEEMWFTESHGAPQISDLAWWWKDRDAARKESVLNLKNETPGTEAPRASTENPFPVANCEERLSEPEALSSSADKNRQKLRPLVVKTIGTVDLVELAMGWLRYQALRSVAEPNFDERVDMLLVEKEGL
jgi:hypothetical protein